MPLLTNLIEVLGTLESSAISIHEERCVAIRNRNASCLRCADACTSGAILYKNNELIVDPDSCIGCGSCATACPTCAIEVKTPSDEDLLADVKSVIRASHGHPVIACEKALSAVDAAWSARKKNLVDRFRHDGSPYDARQICAVPCLGRIDESLLVGLGAYKVHSATLVCGKCESCKHAPGGRLARNVLESASNMLKAFNSPLEIELTEELPQRVVEHAPYDPQVSCASDRRAFFTDMRSGAVRVASQLASKQMDDVLGAANEEGSAPVSAAYQKVNGDGTLSHFVPQRRLRVYNYLKHIGQPVLPVLKTRIIGSVELDVDACDACRMCAVFCPTGALEKHDGEDFFGVLHRPAKCMQCRLCESICPQGAIKVVDEVPADQFMGRKALAYHMKKPQWQPNKPTSMYSKVHNVLGEDLEMCMF